MSFAERARIAFVLNGEPRELEVDPLARLLDVLRVELGLTGTKEGCGEGECGACTVLVDGEALNACLLAACQADGRELRTIESAGFESIQRAFLDEQGTQCGICTPGCILATRAWIDDLERDGRPPDRAGARRALAGNLCRCTGYEGIVRSMLAAAERERA